MLEVFYVDLEGFLLFVFLVIFLVCLITLIRLVITGFGAALLGSLIYSAFGVIIDSALERLFSKQ